jgi:hypothetical protein
MKMFALTAILVSPAAFASFVDTGWTSELQIYMDNGRTYFSFPGFTPSGGCQNNRLELRDTGDLFNSVENARRMYALILFARTAGKRIKLGYDNSDGTQCRVAEV